MPADGVKGKTWGPSTCHQRERGQITMLRPAQNRSIFSKSAPNLDKTRALLGGKSPHEIGNSSPPRHNNNSSPTDSVKSSGFQLFLSKALTPLSEIKRFGLNTRNNSLPMGNNASAKKGLGSNNRLSRSIGNIADSHYESIFSTNSFVVAKGVSNSMDFSDRDDL